MWYKYTMEYYPAIEQNEIMSLAVIWMNLETIQRRLLRVPWTARRFNQSILKEISPEYSLEGQMLELLLLLLSRFGHVQLCATP